MFETETEFEPDPVIEAYRKDIDRTLIRENLKLTVEQRFEKLARLMALAEELRKAGREQEIASLTFAALKSNDSPPASAHHQPRSQRR